MKYMLLIHGDEKAMAAATPVNQVGMNPAYAAYNDALIKAGVLLAGERLRPTDTGASLRVTNGKTEMIEGPYADTKEQLAGFYMIDVPDLETAIAWAEKCPAATRGTVEVRPVWLTRPE